MTEQQQQQVARQRAGAPAAGQAPREEAVQRPPVDIFEDADGLLVHADMPGVTRERLRLNVEDDQLTIEGDAQIDVPAEVKPLHAEVRSTRYRRTFALSRELDTERIEAKLRDGVLTLRIPKRAELKPRKIEVSVS